jgi:hypothetical protein
MNIILKYCYYNIITTIIKAIPMTITEPLELVVLLLASDELDVVEVVVVVVTPVSVTEPVPVSVTESVLVTVSVPVPVSVSVPVPVPVPVSVPVPVPPVLKQGPLGVDPALHLQSNSPPSKGWQLPSPQKLAALLKH